MANINPPIYRCTLCRDELIVGENYTIGYERFRKNKLCCDVCIIAMDFEFQTPPNQYF